MNQKILFIGAILLFCGAVKSDEVNQDNDNYYLNGFSIEQEEPIGTRREGDYYDAYPGQLIGLIYSIVIALCNLVFKHNCWT